MEKEEIKSKVLSALWLLQQREKGTKKQARNLLYDLFIKL